MAKRRKHVANFYEYSSDKNLDIKPFSEMTEKWLQFVEEYIDGMIRVYNDEICDTLDNYNSSAYYEPSYVITRAYNNGGF